MELSFENWLSGRRAVFNDHARARMADGVGDGVLADAMRAGVLRPGKRYRPLLLLAVAENLGATPGGEVYRAALDAALAAECFHSASLIYDDLPAMDNAGKRGDAPSLHRALETSHPGRGVALAILCAHGLTAHGFALLSLPGIPERRRLDAIRIFADAIGAANMAGGQAREFSLSAGKNIDGDNDDDIGKFVDRACRKTYPLFGAAAAAGAMVAGADGDSITYHNALGLELGEAYQLADDLRDADEDEVRGISTPARLFPGKTRDILFRCLRHAREFARDGDRAFPLRDFIEWFASRCEGNLP